MAKSITFDIAVDADALRILNGVCDNNNYESNKIGPETKQEFFRRATLNWWAGQTSQAESRAVFKANEAEIKAFDITSSEV
jgi:hypothetical protein